jgi:hypothetical protein
MFGNQLVLVVELPSPRQQLPHFDLGLVVGSLSGTRRDIDQQPAQANRIVVAHGGLISKADDAIQILGSYTPGRLHLLSWQSKPTIESLDKSLQESIRLLDSRNPLQPKFCPQPILKGPKQFLHPPLGLGGKSKEGPNP